MIKIDADAALAATLPKDAPTLADAILDRVIHNDHKITLKGESMRKTKKRLTKNKPENTQPKTASFRSDGRSTSPGTGMTDRLPPN